MVKRKQSSDATSGSPVAEALISPELSRNRRAKAPKAPRAPRSSNVTRQKPPLPDHQHSHGNNSAIVNPNANSDIIDGLSALRASPDGAGDVALAPGIKLLTRNDASNAVEPASATTAVIETIQPGDKNKRKKSSVQHVTPDSAGTNGAVDGPTAEDVTRLAGDAPAQGVGVTGDHEGDHDLIDEYGNEEEVKEQLSRPPPVNSDYLPLPWKGRLGYACLNTYLRNANPPVFSSRTCRIASILEHRHPLKDPSQPEHPTKNRPDKGQPPDVARGQKYVEEIGLANARDIIKMVRWNDKYGIKFMRLSSEMFPFASHDEYGYRLKPFAAETLREAGKVVADLGHRVTTHPGQFTQLGSPRKQVIDAAFRDLDYHDEMLSLLELPPQQDRDAVMILHLGGAFGDKEATLDRFRENYGKLSPSVKNRLVLENDDVVWSVHELLPLCQELNIPFVLDFHHHNIIFDSSKIREGTKDIMELFPAILETWTKKGKTPKMHYSEPCTDAITGRARRKHSPRVMTLPPCPNTMDLMIEAKDKEQAVFELMRTFKLPGFDLFNDIIPHQREDENTPLKLKSKKSGKQGKKKKVDNLEDAEIDDAESQDVAPASIDVHELGMGGPERRVYWPPGMEEWLRPPKRVIKKKDDGVAASAQKKRKTAVAAAGTGENAVSGETNGDVKVKTLAKKTSAPKRTTSLTKMKVPKTALNRPSSDEEDSSPLSDLGSDNDEDNEAPAVQKRAAALGPTRRRTARASRVSYKEEEVDEMSV